MSTITVRPQVTAAVVDVVRSVIEQSANGLAATAEAPRRGKRLHRSIDERPARSENLSPKAP